MTSLQRYSPTTVYDNHAANNIRQYPEVFALADQLLFQAREMLSGSLASNDMRGHVLSLLFGRVISGAQAVVLLARAGLSVEADTIFRSSTEALFRLGAIGRQPQLIEDYLAEDHTHRQNAMGDLKALRSMDACYDGITDAKIDTVLRDVSRQRQAQLKQMDMTSYKKMHVSEWAKHAGQDDLYYSKYLLTSGAVHHSARDIERALVRDGSGKVVALSFVPDAGNPTLTIADALVVLARGCEAFGTAIDRSVPAAFIDVYADVQRIYADAARTFEVP